jgi:hypothetical protein
LHQVHGYALDESAGRLPRSICRKLQEALGQAVQIAR